MRIQRATLSCGALVSVAALICLGNPAAAEPNCAAREKVLQHLSTKYSEAPVAIGVTSAGALLEVLATGNGTTWTIILTRPDGQSCLIAAGEGWRPVQTASRAPEI